MVVCPKCRTGRKAYAPASCVRCGTPELNFGKRITLPKKNNHRAWKSILEGNPFWDEHKVAKAPWVKAWHEYHRNRKSPGARLLEKWNKEKN